MSGPEQQEPTVIASSLEPAEPVYQLITYTGAVEEGRHDQLWGVTWANQFNRTRWKKATLTTLQIKELVDADRHVRLPELEPVTYDAAAGLPVDPYVMGILLAEGSLETEGVSFASADPEIVKRVRENLPPGHKIMSMGVKHRITIGMLGRANKDANLILKAARDLGLTGHRSWEKFVPDDYKFASVEDRLELVRGYFDGDGSIKADGNIRVSTASERLASDIQEIIRSLGGDCKLVRITNKTYIYQGAVTDCRDEYRINGIALRMNPFWVPRKADRYVFSQRSMNQFRRIRSVKIVKAPGREPATAANPEPDLGVSSGLA
jgi:hypothetical protein